MEASSLNKMLLVPHKDSDYPLLVTKDNFDDIFSTNFSPRTHVAHFNEESNLEAIYNHLKTDNPTASKLWFDSYFNVQKGAEVYRSLYLNQHQPKNSNNIDIVINILYAIKTFVLR